LTPATLLADSH